MEKHEIAAILSDTRYFIQNSHGDRLYDIEWQYNWTSPIHIYYNSRKPLSINGYAP
jgi:hypothetical protein